MTNIPALLKLMLLSSTLISIVTLDRALAQESAPVETMAAPETSARRVQGISNKDLDALFEAVRIGAAPEALAKLEAQADLKNRHALHLLGEIYSKGPLLIDGEKAFDYYMDAVEAGNTSSLVRLGDLYHDGSIFEADYDKAMEYYQRAVAEGNDNAKLRLGSALIKGTLGPADPDKGLSLLEGLAKKANRQALHELGELYSKGPLPMDGAKAADYYTQAVTAGNISSLVRLGDLYRDGTLIEADQTKAMEYYQGAAAEGNDTAQLRLGSALIKGTLGPADPDKGLLLLEGLAKKANRQALHELGELYNKGPLPIDGVKAVDYYTQAVAAGNISSLVRLGDLYRDGTLVEADPEQAIAFYEQAHSAGLSSSLRNLALGHTESRFGHLSQPAKGVQMLQEAVKDGDMSASTALANLYFNGNGVAKDPKRGLQLLRQAAEAGNSTAARSLISVLRNGRGKDLPRNLSDADTAMNKYASLFNQADLELEKIVLKSARADSKKEFSAVAAAMNEASPALQQRMLTMMHGSNRNVYTWLLQERLAEIDLYKGPLNGIMTTSTIRAVSAYCAQNDLHAECAQGPLHWSTARVLAHRLYN